MKIHFYKTDDKTLCNNTINEKMIIVRSKKVFNAFYKKDICKKCNIKLTIKKG